MKSLNNVKVLAVGDIIGKGARNAFIKYLPTLKAKYDYDIVIVNGENSTHGAGLNYKHYKEYVSHGVDVITMGNHMLDKIEIIDYIGKTNDLVVPGNANYQAEELNKHKQCVIDCKGHKIKIINLLGKVDEIKGVEVTDPYKYFDNLYQEDDKSIYIVDFHGEYTMEKNLFGYYVDGRASLVYGTHTHVQTADERLLPLSTAFISDVGMCGSVDSVIGFDYQSNIKRIKEGTRSEISTRTPMMVNAVLAEIDLDNKKALIISRINEIM